MALEKFDPVSFSLAECQFLIDHIGEPTTVALAALPLPGVVPVAVKNALDEINELLDREKHLGEVWVGTEVIKDSLRTYLTQAAKWASDKKRFARAPRFPSMHSYDARNRPHIGGPGADSGRVKTYFDKKGNRVPFAVDIHPTSEGGWVPEWAANNEADIKAQTAGISVDAENRRVECPVCKHTESFNPESRASFNAARARMSKHLRASKEKTDLHRELYTNEFGS